MMTIVRVRNLCLVAVLLSIAAACSSAGAARSHCRNGKRTVDIAIYLDSTLSPGQLADYNAQQFKPGSVAIGGIRNYDFALGPADNVVYLYTDTPLSRDERNSVRGWGKERPKIKRVAFDVLPGGGFVPSGECSK